MCVDDDDPIAVCERHGMGHRSARGRRAVVADDQPHGRSLIGPAARSRRRDRLGVAGGRLVRRPSGGVRAGVLPLVELLEIRRQVRRGDLLFVGGHHSVWSEAVEVSPGLLPAHGAAQVLRLAAGQELGAEHGAERPRLDVGSGAAGDGTGDGARLLGGETALLDGGRRPVAGGEDALVPVTRPSSSTGTNPCASAARPPTRGPSRRGSATMRSTWCSAPSGPATTTPVRGTRGDAPQTTWTPCSASSDSASAEPARPNTSSGRSSGVTKTSRTPRHRSRARSAVSRTSS